MIVPFSHMGGFLISGYKPLYLHFFNKDLTFTFENYVKCQIHLPPMSDIYNRNIKTFYNTLKFFSGEDKFEEDCLQALGYFYEDTSHMLCNVLKENPEISTEMKVEVDIPRKTNINIVELEMSFLLEELSIYLSAEESSRPSLLGTGVFTLFSFSELNKLVPNKTLALATSLYQYRKEPIILEVRDGS